MCRPSSAMRAGLVAAAIGVEPGRSGLRPRGLAGPPPATSSPGRGGQSRGLYPHAGVRLGAEATKQAFLEGLATYDIIHFAGHAIVNPKEPSSSFLAFAPPESQQGSGILYARDLYDLPFPASRLVVLSACSTVLGDSRSGEGLAGLARPFLSAGIPAVVGSLWRIDDTMATAFFLRFYARMSEGAQPHEALRFAQIEMLNSSESRLSTVASWAGFEVLGSGDS